MSHDVTRVLIPPKKIVVITAPSGAGKSSIVRKLLVQNKELAFSISCTTREKRVGEEDGKDYHFVSVEEFKRKIENNEFVEHEEVYPGRFYGTLKSEVEKIWARRKVAVFDIDVKGAENLKKQFGKDALTIFIQPPSKEALINRLKNRASEDDKSLKARIKRSEEELGYADKFDRIVLNHDFDTAYMRVKNHITSFLAPQTEHVHGG
jgi:guanylate kinase